MSSTTDRNQTSYIPGPEIIASLSLLRRKISDQWSLELQEKSIPDPQKDPALISQGEDLLSVLWGCMLTDRELNVRSLSPLFDCLRSHQFSSSDLVAQAMCLLQAIDMLRWGQAIMTDAEAEGVLKKLASETIKALQLLMRETADVYEYSVEQGGRGFCHTDSAGRIIYANDEMVRILGEGPYIDREFADYFGGDEAKFVRNVLAESTPAGPELRRLMLLRSDAEVVPVGAELASISLDGAKRGGYASVVDLSRLEQQEISFFEKAEIGIIKVVMVGGGDPEKEDWLLSYVNPKAQKIIGLSAWQKKSLRGLFPEKAAWEEIRQHLVSRFRNGLAEEYQIAITRPENGKRIPIQILAVPVTDLRGNIVGSMAIIRDLSDEVAREEIHNALTSFTDGQTLFDRIRTTIGKLLDYDLMTLSFFDPEMKEVKLLNSHSPKEEFPAGIRWWKIPDKMMEKMPKDPLMYIKDFSEVVADPDLSELKTDPYIQWMLEKNLRSILSCRVLIGGSVAVSLGLFRKGVDRFSEEDMDVLKRLPLLRALMTLHHVENDRKFKFRHSIMNEVIKNCDNLKKVSEIIVEKIRDCYCWESVAIFEVGEEIKLLSQCPKGEPLYSLPDEYSQDKNEGVLGEVYKTNQPIYIPDVKKSPSFMLEKDSSRAVKSECCLPIFVNERLFWLLNVEDSHENAIAKSEFDELKSLVNELIHLLDRASLKNFLEVVLKTASDAIVVTDKMGRIQMVNHAAVSMLKTAEQVLKEGNFKTSFVDGKLFKRILDGWRPPEEQVDLLDSQGESIFVHLSAAHLPEEEGIVFIARDLRYRRKTEELHWLQKMYREVALQTKTPISLIFSWLRTLKGDATEISPQETQDVLDKTLKQLRKIELTYDRLVLYGQKNGFFPPQLTLLELGELIDDIVQALPDSWAQKITLPKAEELLIRGNVWQLSFCVESILSYLLRSAPETKGVQIELINKGKIAQIVIAGDFPIIPRSAVGRAGEVALVSKLLADTVLGKTTIASFIESNGGKLFAPKLDGTEEAAAFRIELPLALDAKEI